MCPVGALLISAYLKRKNWRLALKQIIFNLLKNKNEMTASEYSEFFIAIKMLNRSVMV